MQLSNRVYDTIKFVALVLLPGSSAAYFSLAQVWGLPNAEKVVGTLTIIDTLLGLILKASTTQYKKSGVGADGELYVNDDTADGTRYLSVGLRNERDLMMIPEKDVVTLKVVDKTIPERLRE